MDFETDKLVDTLQAWWLGLSLEEKRRAWELYGMEQRVEKELSQTGGMVKYPVGYEPSQDTAENYDKVGRSLAREFNN